MLLAYAHTVWLAQICSNLPLADPNVHTWCFFFSCRKKCLEKLSEEAKQEVFNKFYSFGSKNEQDAYLQSLISAVTVQRKRPKNNGSKPKPHKWAYKYNINYSLGQVLVCKNAFLCLHAISKDRVHRLCLLLSAGKSPQDLRGKNNPGNSKPVGLIDLICSHISSFPIKEAHYSSRHYKYLSEKLDIKKMHDLFLSKYPHTKVKYSLYYKVFKERFSLNFGRPQVDSCCKCEELSVKIKSKELNDTAKRVAVAEKTVHLRRAKKFHSKMNTLKELYENDPSVAIVAVDYMQNIFLPQIPVQETFYLHQLTVSVFDIHDVKTGRAYFYIYHEGMGRKGPDEVCSFIANYIESYVPPEVQHLHVFMDGCPGQNKNHTTARMFASLIEIERFKTIHQYFPIRGHSFLPCDRDFGVVKRSLKKNDRVYTLKQYAELFIVASQQNKFTVHLIEDDNSIIKSFKTWWPKFYKRNCSSTDAVRSEKIPFNISRFMQLSYNDTSKGMVTAYDYIDGIVSYTFPIGTKRLRPSILCTELAYPDIKLPIKNKKMVNIKKFASYLPDDDEIQSFYQEVFLWPTVDGELEPEVL